MRPRPSRRVNLPAGGITVISQKSETEQKLLARVFVRIYMVYMTEKRGVRGQRCNLSELGQFQGTWGFRDFILSVLTQQHALVLLSSFSLGPISIQEVSLP